MTITKRAPRNKKLVIYETSRVVGLLESMAADKETTVSEIVRTILRGALDRPAGHAEDWLCKLTTYFRERQETAPEFYTAPYVARDMGCSPAMVGNLIQTAFPIRPVKGKGYPSARINALLGAQAKPNTEGGTE